VTGCVTERRIQSTCPPVGDEMCPPLPALSQCGRRKYGFTSALIRVNRVEERIFTVDVLAIRSHLQHPVPWSILVVCAR
jgi:hypothetical protein